MWSEIPGKRFLPELRGRNIHGSILPPSGRGRSGTLMMDWFCGVLGRRLFGRFVFIVGFVKSCSFENDSRAWPDDTFGLFFAADGTFHGGWGVEGLYFLKLMAATITSITISRHKPTSFKENLHHHGKRDCSVISAMLPEYCRSKNRISERPECNIRCTSDGNGTAVPGWG